MLAWPSTVVVVVVVAHQTFAVVVVVVVVAHQTFAVVVVVVADRSTLVVATAPECREGEWRPHSCSALMPLCGVAGLHGVAVSSTRLPPRRGVVPVDSVDQLHDPTRPHSVGEWWTWLGARSTSARPAWCHQEKPK